jgi:hypothetical protein
VVSVTHSLIRPATADLAYRTAPYLRWQDVREIETCGWHPLFCVSLSVTASEDPIAFYTPSGEIAGFAGIRREDDISGVVWMLCTTAVEKIPILFCKEARAWLDRQTTFQILHNVADPRNTLHMKLLKHLGFKRLGYQPVGPKRTTFVEFARIQPCVIQ